MFAVSQGAAVLGLTVFILSYYLPKNKTEAKSGLSWHVVIVASSYLMLTLATMQTAIYQVYPWGNVWYWIVAVAYISGDVSLIFVFRNAVKKRRIEKIKEQEQENLKSL